MIDKLKKLLKWAKATHQSSTDEGNRRFMEGYMQAIKDILNIKGIDAFMVQVDSSRGAECPDV